MMAEVGTKPSEPAASKILPLTSARFFAALFVVFFHGWPLIHASTHPHNLLARTIGLGYVSVSFFFMLSGFILAIVYLRDEKPVNRKRFFISRFARIYPLYVASILLDLPHFIHIQRFVTHGSVGQSLAKFAATIVLVQAWSPNLRGINDPSWSLSAEAFFYLLFPFLGAYLIKLRPGTTLVLSLLLYSLGLWLVDSLHTNGQTYSPFPHLFVFVLGINLAQLFRWTSRTNKRRLALERLAPWMLVFSLAACFAIPVLQLPIPEILMQHGLLAPLFALCILALASGNHMISTLFSHRWLIVLGEASFALYLLHEPVAALLRQPMERYGTPLFLAYVLCLVGLSILSLFYLETPCRLLILGTNKSRSLENQANSALMQ